jgi:hypothetical protein
VGAACALLLGRAYWDAGGRGDNRDEKDKTRSAASRVISRSHVSQIIVAEIHPLLLTGSPAKA